MATCAPTWSDAAYTLSMAGAAADWRRRAAVVGAAARPAVRPRARRRRASLHAFAAALVAVTPLQCLRLVAIPAAADAAAPLEYGGGRAPKRSPADSPRLGAAGEGGVENWRLLPHGGTSELGCRSGNVSDEAASS